MRTGYFAAGAVLLVAGGPVGWLIFGHGSAHLDASPATAAIPVTAGIARTENVPVFVQGIGTVQAINTVNAKSRVDGEIIATYFKQGMEVKQGDKLFAAEVS